MTELHVLGDLDIRTRVDFAARVAATEGMKVRRLQKARSATTLPNSTDLEIALVPLLEHRGFKHRVRLQHLRTNERFEHDFWRGTDQMALEIMGDKREGMAA